MRHSFFIVFGGLLLAATALAHSAAADEPTGEEGFLVLFDGKSLAGWHKNPQRIGHGTGGTWNVEDGAICGQQDPPGSGNGGILLSDRKFADFELRLEMKPDWGVDSGVFLRCTPQGQCYQMMVDYHDAGNVGHIYGEGTGGFNNRPFLIDGKYDERRNLLGLTTRPSGLKVPPAYSCSPEQFVKAWKINDWNEARLRVEGQPPRITTWINGLKITEFDGASYDGPGYDKQRVGQVLGREGRPAGRRPKILSSRETVTMKRHAYLAIAAMAALGVTALAVAEDKEKKFKATCPVSGGPAKEASSLDYLGKKVYFCCNNCPKAFAKDPAKFATKANAQLLETGHIVQVACPLTGRPINPEAVAEVGPVKVAICCNGCKGKVEAADAATKLTLVFAKLDKGFTLQTACPVSGKPIKADKFVEYKGKKVYFCCPGCPGAFEKNPEKYLSKLPQFQTKEEKE